MAQTIELFGLFIVSIITVFGLLIWVLFRKGITGPKFLIFVVAFFGLVITVNVGMAFQAAHTFPGLEEETGNGYDESQAFDKIMRAQIALGWNVDLGYHNKTFSMAILGKDGKPAKVASVKVLIGRPTEESDDRWPALTDAGGVYKAQTDLAPGKWMVKVSAVAADGTQFHQRLSLIVSD
ncbi:MAG: FixH family protein [Paracoccaceae bacterium]|nr:FixH family protein [Paracoccaceae bacterium]